MFVLKSGIPNVIYNTTHSEKDIEPRVLGCKSVFNYWGAGYESKLLTSAR